MNQYHILNDKYISEEANRIADIEAIEIVSYKRSRAWDAVGEKYDAARQMIALANTVEGAIGVKAAAMSVREKPPARLKAEEYHGRCGP